MIKYFKKLYNSSSFYKKNAFSTGDINHSFGLDNNIPKATVNAYRQNVVVHRCVDLIAQSASHVPWYVSKKDRVGYSKVASHPILTLLKRPNYNEAGAEFFIEIIASLLLTGNAFLLELSLPNAYPKELYLLDTNSVEVLMNDGKLVGYKHNNKKFYAFNRLTHKCKILHIKNYNPIDQKYGLSCLESASMSIDLHNQSVKWNNSLLRNGARPSGALILKDSNSYLDEQHFERLKEQFYEKYSGASNSGTPLLLEGGLDWKEMSISPRDMDFIESKNAAAREIALAFGVPPQLLGINGDNTYSNMQEARLALWEETLIPLLDRLSDAMTVWFSNLFEEDIILDFDREAISALTEKRENLWSKISSANFMTINEKRAMVNLPSIKGGDVLS